MDQTTFPRPIKEIMDFRAYEAAPGISVIVLPDAPTYTHVAVSNDFIRATGLRKADVIGKGHFAVFPKSPDDPNFTGELNLRASFETIIQQKEPHEIPVQRYDIPNGDGTFRQRYWKINNAPILSDTGEILYIVHTAADITEQVMAKQREERIRELEKSYNLFMQAPVVIGIVKGDGYVIELANDDLLRVWGRTVEVIGKPLFEAIPELQGQGIKELLDGVRNTGEPFFAFEHPVKLVRNGKEEFLYFDFVYKPFYEEGQEKASGVFAVGHDITKQVEARQKFKNIIEQATDPILILKGADMVLEVANEALFRLWNVDSTALGKAFLDILPEMRGQGFLELLQQVYYTGKPFQGYEVPAIFEEANGETRTMYFNFTYQPYREADGSITGVLVLATDVTGQVLAQKQAEESQKELKRFKFMVENAQDAVFLVREDGVITYLNQKGMDQLGYTAEEIIKLRVVDIDPFFDEAMFADAFDKSQHGGARIETFHQRKDGHIFPVEVNLSNFTYNGTPYMFAIARDITDRRQFETSIKESTAKWQQLANTMPVIVWTGEVDGSVKFFNSRWYEFTGLTEGESVNFGWTTVLHPDDVDRCLAVWENARKNEAHYEVNVRYRSKAGEYRWVLGRGVPIKNETGGVVAWYGTSTDIHDQILLAEELEKRVQERTQELESQHHLLNSILKNSTNGISVSRVSRDGNGNVIDARTILANDSAVKYVGIPKEIYLSKRATEIEPDIMNTPYYQACINTLETGEPFIMQYQMQSSGRWLELTVSRLDRDHLIHIFTDVTSIKEAQLQLEQSVENLRQANESLEEFAYAASHDLKEPIRKIHFFSDRLRQQLADKLSEEQKMFFHRLENASRRMGSLIEDLLSYSYAAKGLPEQEEVNLNKKVQLVLEDLEIEVQQNGAKISVEDLPVIKGSKRQMQQLFQNLITNALKYSKPGVVPEIKITYQWVSGSEIKRDLHAVEQDKFFHLIKVHDHGIGFSQEDAQRIFNVFTRLHGNSEYKGTGVGLSIAQRVVQNHGGYIWAESTPGKGATFNVLLPAESKSMT